MTEPILEPLARYFRFQQSVPFLPNEKLLTVLDIGCGPTVPFYDFLLKSKRKIKKYWAVDVLPKSLKSPKVLKLLKNTTDIKTSSCDLVVSFAVLEHVDEPKRIISESIRVLKKGGVAIFTSPSKKSKWLLEFLSFRLGMISSREIKEHKRYFQIEDLLKLVKPYKRLVAFHHEYFELGMNNLVVLRKV